MSDAWGPRSVRLPCPRVAELSRAGSGDVQLAETEPCVPLIVSPASDVQIRGVIGSVHRPGLDVIELQAPVRSAAPAICGNVAALVSVSHEHLTPHCRGHVTSSLQGPGAP